MFVRGLGVESAYPILLQKGVVILPSDATTPPVDVWQSSSDNLRLSEWVDRGPAFFWKLPGPLKRNDSFEVECAYPVYKRGKNIANLVGIGSITKTTTYVRRGSEYCLRLDLKQMIGKVRAKNVRLKDKVRVDVRFVLKAAQQAGGPSPAQASP